MWRTARFDSPSPLRDDNKLRPTKHPVKVHDFSPPQNQKEFQVLHLGSFSDIFVGKKQTF